MSEYTYTRRYDAPIYRVVCVVCCIIAVAFGIAAFTKPVASAFSVLFALGSAILALGIRGKWTSGILIDDSTLRWVQTGYADQTGSIDLHSILSIEWHRFDTEWMMLTLEDQSQVRLDHRYFGDGRAFLNALRERLPNLPLTENGKPWNG